MPPQLLDCHIDNRTRDEERAGIVQRIDTSLRIVEAEQATAIRPNRDPDRSDRGTAKCSGYPTHCEIVGKDQLDAECLTRKQGVQLASLEVPERVDSSEFPDVGII